MATEGVAIVWILAKRNLSETFSTSGFELHLIENIAICEIPCSHRISYIAIQYIIYIGPSGAIFNKCAVCSTPFLGFLIHVHHQNRCSCSFILEWYNKYSLLVWKRNLHTHCDTPDHTPLPVSVYSHRNQQ